MIDAVPLVPGSKLHKYRITKLGQNQLQEYNQEYLDALAALSDR